MAGEIMCKLQRAEEGSPGEKRNKDAENPELELHSAAEWAPSPTDYYNEHSAGNPMTCLKNEDFLYNKLRIYGVACYYDAKGLK